MQKETTEVKHVWPEDWAAVVKQGVPTARADWGVRWA